MRWVLRRQGLYLAIAGVLAAVVVTGGLALLHNRPAHANGNGCTASDTTPVCSFKGNTAFAQFQTNTDCVSTAANVFVADDVTLNPPNSATGGLVVELAVQSDNFCTRTFDSASGETNNATFSLVDPLKSATLTASVPMTDDFDPTQTFTITVSLTWEGYGPISTQIDSSHFRTSGTTFSSHFHATSRNARCSGSITDGMTEYAPNPSIENDIQHTDSGTISITH